MDGIRIKGVHQGITLSELPLGARHVRMTIHVETAEERREKLRSMLKSNADKLEGFLEHMDAAPTFVQKEVVEFRPKVEQPKEDSMKAHRKIDPASIFTVYMGETMKTLVYKPDAILHEEVSKICRARDWNLEERVILTLKVRMNIICSTTILLGS